MTTAAAAAEAAAGDRTGDGTAGGGVGTKKIYARARRAAHSTRAHAYGKRFNTRPMYDGDGALGDVVILFFIIIIILNNKLYTRERVVRTIYTILRWYWSESISAVDRADTSCEPQ